MKLLEKLVWSEGTLLTQQHFQAWEDYWEENRILQLRLTERYFWGFSLLEIDESLLLNGRLSLLRCQAIFPDGRIVTFDAQKHGTLICELPSNHPEPFGVYLSLPLNNHIHGLSGYANPIDYGWKVQYKTVQDQYDTNREREVAFATPNLSLCTKDQLKDQALSLKIAEVKHRIHHEYELVKNYIPPVVHLLASDRLKNQLQQIQQLLEAKIQWLLQKKSNYGENSLQWGRQDIFSFLLLQTLERQQAKLHVLDHKNAHPSECYETIVELLAALKVFSHQERLEIPDYQHDELGLGFQTLSHHIEKILQKTLPTNLQYLNLTRHSQTLCMVQDLDPTWFSGHVFYLEVKWINSDLTWIKRFLQQAKIASHQDIQKVIGSALPAVTLNPVLKCPANLPIKVGVEYFYLVPQGEYWQRIVEQRNLALFAPLEFSGAEFGLIVIKE